MDPIVFIHCRSFSDGKLTERPPVRRLHKNKSSGPQVFHHPFRVLAYLQKCSTWSIQNRGPFANIFKVHYLREEKKRKKINRVVSAADVTSPQEQDCSVKELDSIKSLTNETQMMIITEK